MVGGRSRLAEGEQKDERLTESGGGEIKSDGVCCTQQISLPLLHKNLPMHGEPNSMINFGNGHAVVYGPDGKAIADISSKRVKQIKWNTNPNTGESYAQRHEKYEIFKEGVPKEILKELGID